MSIFKANIIRMLKNIPDFPATDIPFFSLAALAEKAGFNINTLDAAVFATGAFVAHNENLPLVSEEMGPIGGREYGRAAVAGWRSGSLIGYYEAIDSSIIDGLLPESAYDVCMQNSNIGMMAFNFYEKR